MQVHLISTFTVILLLFVGVQNECLKDDKDDMLSLLFKKLEKMEDKSLKLHEEMAAMAEKLQQQEEITDFKVEELKAMKEKNQELNVEMAAMREKLQGQEEITELKIERIQEKCGQFEYKTSMDENIESNNETSLAMAVLQLSHSLESLKTYKGGEDTEIESSNKTSLANAVLQLTNSLENLQSRQGGEVTDIESQLTKQISRLVSSLQPSVQINMSHVDAAIEKLTNGLSEFQTTVEDLQNKVQSFAVSGGYDEQQLVLLNNKTSSYQASKQRTFYQTVKPRYCHDIYIQGERRDGVYQIFPTWNETKSVQVWCEFDVGHEIGWTIILSRTPTETPVNFSRTWDDYKTGFGDPNTEYWIGLEFLYQIFRSHCSQVLQVSLQSWGQLSRHAQYEDFRIGDEESGYELSIGRYSGDAGDALSYNNAMKFSTNSIDNDKWGNHCAASENEGAGAGFWYKSCSHTFPFNTLRQKGDAGRGMRWNKWLSGENLKKMVFKIAPRLPSFV